MDGTTGTCPKCNGSPCVCVNGYSPQPLINQGWQCPKCGNVYSPMYMECARCNANNYQINMAGSSG